MKKLFRILVVSLLLLGTSVSLATTSDKSRDNITYISPHSGDVTTIQVALELPNVVIDAQKTQALAFNSMQTAQKNKNIFKFSAKRTQKNPITSYKRARDGLICVS